ncbi:hypothetical protein ACTU45_33960 [Streptomyces sp. 24-1644]
MSMAMAMAMLGPTTAIPQASIVWTLDLPVTRDGQLWWGGHLEPRHHPGR